MSSRFLLRSQSFWTRVRNNPAAIAVTAGIGGLVCGAMVVGLLVPPAPQQVAATPRVETTGSATQAKEPSLPAKIELAKTEPTKTEPTKTEPTKTEPARTDSPKLEFQTTKPLETTASTAIDPSVTDCDQQAWPYITPQCLAERESGQRKVRVISTDKLAAPVVSAIEATPSPSPSPSPKPKQASAPIPSPPQAISPAPVPRPASVRVDPVTETPATPTVAPASSASAEPPAAGALFDPTPQSVASTAVRGKNARDTREKRKRDAKRDAKSRRAPVQDDRREARDDIDDDDAESTRTVAQDSRRSGRVVERWTEREYEMPSYDSSLRRRVIVVRRGGDRGNPYMPSARAYSRSVFQY